MSCLNPFDVQSRHIMTTDGHAESLYAGVGGRGVNSTCWCIGNGQVHDLYLSEKCRCLNCMDDPMKIIVKKGENDGK